MGGAIISRRLLYIYIYIKHGTVVFKEICNKRSLLLILVKLLVISFIQRLSMISYLLKTRLYTCDINISIKIKQHNPIPLTFYYFKSELN